MTRIIPGVQVTVVKDVVPPQLAPSGILGLVGFCEITPARIQRASSWSRFLEVFGKATAYSIPEARAALENGVSEIVISPLASGDPARVEIPTAVKSQQLVLTARASGSWANDFTVTIAAKTVDGEEVFDLTVRAPGNPGEIVEVHKKLTMQAGTDRFAEKIIGDSSAVVRVAAAGKGSGALPTEGSYRLVGGSEAPVQDYESALAALENEPDVDMVLASTSDVPEVDPAGIVRIYSKVISHCERMSKESKGRIGFGQVPSVGGAADWVGMSEALLCDRFVLVAPHGVVGAVAGRVGSLDYYQSPTFKTLAGLGPLSRVLGLEEQKALLVGNVVPVVTQRGKGTIIVRGLTTDGDQISVRRIADRAVRGVKMLGDLFIGRLNNDDGRRALKQKLIEFLVQMVKEGALVPSTDGVYPPYKVDVYSSQADFAQGIVRVELAVRPVRAIDYIYATILVQV